MVMRYRAWEADWRRLAMFMPFSQGVVLIEVDIPQVNAYPEL
jgi:hypothetical protein